MEQIKIRRVDFYPTDWLEGTVDLTNAERGVYITICAAIYARGGPVEVDHVRRLCPGRGFKRALDGLIKCTKVTRSETLLCNDRCTIEVLRATVRIHQSRTNGTLGGSKINGLKNPEGVFRKNPDPEPIRHQPKDKNKILDKPESVIRARDSKEEGKQVKIAEGDSEEVASLPFDGIGAWHSIGDAMNGLAASSGAPARRGKSPALKAHIRDQLMQKHARYLAAREPDEERIAYWSAMVDPDPAVGQRMFDAIDGRMRGEGWDDVREHEEREMLA